MKKKVLLLTDQLRVGGAETYFFKIENNMLSNNIALITAAEDGEYRNKLKNMSSFVYLSKNPVINVFKIINIVRKEKVDVIHANSLRLSMMSLLAKVIYGKKIKLLYTKHNLTLLERIEDKVFAWYVNSFITKLLTVCELDKKRMVDKGVKEDKIMVVSNSTDTKQFNFNSKYLKNSTGPLNIGILARLDEVKNHILFLDIMEELKETGIEFNAYIAGDGHLREIIAKEIAIRNLNVNMIGNVSDVPKFLEEIDVSLLVSHREVFPMSIIEAFSAGVLVAAVNVGGISDSVKNNETGYLIENHSVKDFVNVIKDIYYNREKNRNIVINARKLVEEEYSLEKMIAKLEKIYMEE
ncbi:glycosyltransferase family 1 protein [Clostridium chromiireducens]|uniref:Glycosyltransferase family 1 protein n=1 Tax=Clostridium chromiireducens TaxID=225345 RepID=A0A399IPM7_9CLOT|nr:glycosyltransferase family 4 protein [Clostridium chromiireducens]RII35013.1 glycosyltransferase family 1 protein [Clostridium chromiireducens]